MNIVAVWKDGTAKIYNHHNKLIKVRKFGNYGQALQFATDYEDQQKLNNKQHS